MAITQEQETLLADVIARAEASDGVLNDWETNFMADQSKRYEEFGSKLNLSPKQWATIQKIEDVLTNGRKERR